MIYIYLYIYDTDDTHTHIYMYAHTHTYMLTHALIKSFPDSKYRYNQPFSQIQKSEPSLHSEQVYSHGHGHGHMVTVI